MQSSEIRERFLDFFNRRGYAIIPSASLIPEGDASTLFINSGMQPLVSYLLGQEHPEGKLLVNVQKSWRTGDIEEVGDSTHLTFFEMLGRWRLNDLNKEETIKSTYEFLTKELALKPSRMYVSLFKGNDDAPADKESEKVWESLGVPTYFRGVEDNWWSAGENGPCGPDSEVFYDVTDEGLGALSADAFQEVDNNQEVIEIWNDVFMEYEREKGKVVERLEQQNVDTGVGFERLVAVVQEKDNIFETDLFSDLSSLVISKVTENTESQRIIMDHFRSAIFAISDGVMPSNTDSGYVVRRLIRRTIMHAENRIITPNQITNLVDLIIKKYSNFYPDLQTNREKIQETLHHEFYQFRQTLQRGLKELQKMSIGEFGAYDNSGNEISSAGMEITSANLFKLYASFGFPFEMSIEQLGNMQEELLSSGTIKSPFLTEKKIEELKIGFKKKFQDHQKKSRTATVGKFKGGLADHGDETIKLHTAQHLLLAALQEVLGSEVKQRGSNITPERLRIDFSFGRKLTDEEKQKVEDIVNSKIDEGLDVVRKEMLLKEAEKISAEMEFGQKYPDTVSVYFIQDKDGNVFSKEFCGGPHVENTKELGRFVIKSEKASSLGVRRIKAVLE